MKKLSIILLIGLCSCSVNLDLRGMFDGSSPDPDIRFEESMAYFNATNDTIWEVSSENYVVYVGTDMHIDTLAPTAHTDRFLADFKHESQPHFALILGDIANGQHNIPWIADIFRNAITPNVDTIFFTLGNHDAYFGQWEEWREAMKTSTYWFDVVKPSGKKDLYVCLESGNGTLGKKQMAWLRELLAQKSHQNYEHKIVFTHTHLFKKDGSQGHTSNYNIEETYDMIGLFARTGVDMYLCGHDHSREITVLKGVDFIVVDALEEHDNTPGYLKLYAGEDLKYEFIMLNEEK